VRKQENLKIVGISALALAMVATTRADVTMTLVDAFSDAENSSSFSASVSGYGAVINGDDLIGLYRFNVSANSGSVPGLGSLWATCVSPAGYLDWNTHTYILESFAQASPGKNPAQWAGANNIDGGYGIQNANYLFSTLSQSIINHTAIGQVGSSADQGAALALAMYDVLYNSTGYGHLGGNSFQFTSGGPTGNVLADYDSDLNLLMSATVTSVPGDLLAPNPTFLGAGQDQLFVAGAGSSVPEPSTVSVGAIMLVPLGASIYRIWRKQGRGVRLAVNS
jgi:hypothetical protein